MRSGRSEPGESEWRSDSEDTRVQADSIVENYMSGSPVEEIADNFRIDPEIIRQVLAFAKLQQPQLQL